jgi:hypothetical protein
MFKPLLLALTILLSALPLCALASDAGDVQSVALTIYNGDLAVIREVRPFTLENGVQVLRLSDVSGQLRPETVHLEMRDGWELSLLEQNFDYDLVSNAKLLQKFIGRQITLIDDANKSSIVGTLLSVGDGMVVSSGGNVLLNPPGRVVLPEGAADELLLKPTLSWLVSSPRAGQATGEISYLSGGLNWNADYVMVLAADDQSGSLEGWVTISNYSGTTYKDAALKLVAGDVNRVQEQRQYELPAFAAEKADGAGGGFVEESMFEYHLYDLQRPTTIKNNQQKQIGLLGSSNVPTKKLFTFDGQNGGDIRVEMQFRNDEAAGLGIPLPKGTVRVFKADSKGQTQFVGEDRIEHTPKDEDVSLYVGNAFDIKGEATQTEYKDLGRGYSQSYKVALRNHKEKEDVVVTVRARIGGEWKITASNYDYVKKDASTVEFQVPVKAGGEAELNYGYQVTWR